MSCAEFWNQVARPGGPGGTGHLANCPACAARWERERALTAGLRLLAEDWRHVEAPARVETGLLAAFRVQAGRQRHTATRNTWWTPVLVWASAAAATVALAVALLHPAQPVVTTPGETASPLHPAPVGQEWAAVADSDTLDLENDFIPVPNAAKIEPNEDVNLVRVEVPRSAMMALGIVVGGENASERVLADVVLGSDGMARAVRLVKEASVLDEE